MIPSMRWEYFLGLGFALAAPWAPPTGLSVTLSESGLWFGSIVLGAGLLRDLWDLRRGGEAGGPREVAMCVESIVGVATISLGLLLLTLAFSRLTPTWLDMPLPQQWLVALVGLSLIFAGWVHDLVIVKREGRWSLKRDPNHGSFVVHLFRGKAQACLIGKD